MLCKKFWDDWEEISHSLSSRPSLFGRASRPRIFSFGCQPCSSYFCECNKLRKPETSWGRGCPGILKRLYVGLSRTCFYIEFRKVFHVFLDRQMFHVLLKTGYKYLIHNPRYDVLYPSYSFFSRNAIRRKVKFGHLSF